MDSQIAIEVNHLSKAYKMYDKPVDRLKETLFMGRRTYHRDFYALDDVSFQVKRGETLGIIGRNGAGKSTLLKIITGVLQPTSGEVKVNGRISSLLELGAGFNPEFTGIENIYLNGTVMGFSREEMDERVQDILDFADIGDFVYQPVKTYSSGMYVRLAFAVAINIKPEILIVDEALAVGDARFQLKCYRKFDEFKEKNVTTLFVSHSTDMIKKLCTSAILLDSGKNLYQGDPKETSRRYYDLIFPNHNQDQKHNDKRERGSGNIDSGIMKISEGNGKYYRVEPEKLQNIKIFGVGGAEIDWVELYGTNGMNIFQGGEDICIRVMYSWKHDLVEEQQLLESLEADIGLGIALADKNGNYIFGCNNFDYDIPVDFRKTPSNIFDIKFRMPYLQSGVYFLTMAIALGTQAHHVQLRWYDYFMELECNSCKKNVYGLLHLDYEMEMRGNDVQDY